jgi:Cupin-like domain
MNNAVASCKTLPIERVQGISRESFHESFLVGHRKPAIVLDALDSWPTLKTWTFDLVRARYAADFVFPRVWSRPEFARMMTLGHYLDYVADPGAPSLGFWFDSAMKPCQAPDETVNDPLYLPWNVFSRHPELLEEVNLSPRFTEDWLPLLPEPLRKEMSKTKYFAAGLMIGPEHACVGLHYDFLNTHAYLAQIVGRKRCVLFPPECSAALYNGKVQVDAPDFEKFPRFREATAFQCILEPGELLFIPCGWWHHVVALDKTITLNYNFFNRVNFQGYMKCLLQILPTVVEALEKSPESRAALGIDWVCRGFDFPNASGS